MTRSRTLAAPAPALVAPPAPAPDQVRTDITFRVPRRSPDRVSQALVVLAPLHGPYGYKKHLQLVRGDTIVTVRSEIPVPAEELHRLYTQMRKWCSAVEVVDAGSYPAGVVEDDD